MTGIKDQADVAQLVEQPIRNRQVSGSSPLVGSILFRSLRISSRLPTVQLLYNLFCLPISSWHRRLPRKRS